MEKFNRLYQELGDGIFDDKGLLSLEYRMQIAKELAKECMEKDHLKEIYARHGMPLIGCVNLGNRVDIYSRLKIT